MQPTDLAPERTPDALPADLARFAWFGRIEGISLLLLFGVAMPLKYLADQPLAVTVVGSVHGALFVVFVAWLLWLWRRYRWSFGRGFLLGISSSIPFGFILAETWLKRWTPASSLSV